MAMNPYTPWREQLTEGLKPLQDKLRPPYAGAKHIRAYSSWLVPGMLQTRGYIQTIFATIEAERNLAYSDVQGAVESRLERQQLMHTGDKEYEFLIEEASLRNGIGGAVVMREQLKYLAELIPGDGTPTIGILPISVERHRWPEASFWIFDEHSVNIELVSGSVDLKDPRDIAEYENRFSQLAADAVFGTMAHSLVLAIIESLG